MKFITSTDLKQWADTKECQQLLPELVRKLIVASVKSIDRLSFPSGDATSLSGWDGVVFCDEKIDIVPKGISLWECGATKNRQGKINHDFGVRENDPLGYDKTTSTFVLVTPRVWKKSDDWIKEHQKDWKQVVVYTAVELEDWIEKHPSVGMWLAEKRRILPSGGYQLPETYWCRWAQGKNYIMPYEIVLSGRGDVSKQIIGACENSQSLIIRALTQSEGIAFTIASIITSNGADKLKERLIVVTEKNAFNDLVEHYDNLVLLTTITDSINYAINKGHTVIVASTPADQLNNAVTLPIIEREGFVNALTKIGFDKANARIIAQDTARDINVFRRREGVVVDKPNWVDSFYDLLPAILAGKWMNNNEGDRLLLEKLSGIKYDEYEEKLNAQLLVEDTPLIFVGNMWRIRSPYEAIEYAQNRLTSSSLNNFLEVCKSLIQDDDPEAVDKLNDDVFQLRQNKQKYSHTIKEGVYQNLCLMSIVDNTTEGNLSQWVDNTLTVLYKDWDLSRLLSNRHIITLLAEASPRCFVNFIENISDDILSEVFIPRKQTPSISGWNVNYTEVLCALDMLAWDKEYLMQVTTLLLKLSEYENESNYANKPINSLKNIYRFVSPQTLVPFEDRLKILRLCASKYRKGVFELCLMICKSLQRGILDTNHCYRWRLFGELKTPIIDNRVTVEELNGIVYLMLQCCGFSISEITELITLSFNNFMNCCRSIVIDEIKKHIAYCNDNEIIIETLRKGIHRQKLYQDATWTLPKEELKIYENLLNDIEPQDLLHKKAWLFEFAHVIIPHKHNKGENYKKERQELLAVRSNTLKDIVKNYGKQGIWDFMKMVKCPESMSESLVLLYGDSLIDEICEKYKTKELTESITRSYLYCLYYKDRKKYKKIIKPIVESDNELVITLYAPGYIRDLADLASGLNDNIKRIYWESVNVSFMELDNAEEVVRKIIIYNRYSDAIDIIYHNKDRIKLTDLEIAQIIYGYVTCGSKRISQFDSYHIKSLLEDLDKSDDPEVIRVLLIVEFYLFRLLEHDMDLGNTRFMKELTHDPCLMIELIKAASNLGKDDTGFVAENAFHIINSGCRTQFCLNEKGEVDEDMLNQYIKQLYVWGEKDHKEHMINCVVGDILGNIPRDDDYPPQYLCELVEQLANDTVDAHINMSIYNSRGVIVRSPHEGGIKERQIVSQLNKYREKTMLLYPRMTKIFDGLIKEYNQEAMWEDNRSYISDLEN